MKTIGRTHNGDLLVEMSQKEHSEFRALCSVVAGNNYFWAHDGDMDGTVDLSNVFKALTNLYTAKVNIEQLKNSIRIIDSTFGGTTENKDNEKL